MEYSGKALKDLADPKDPTKITRKAGEQLAGFAELRNDGSTSSGCWIFCGAWGPTGNLMARRDNSDPTGIGNTVNWAFAWPANRRVLYNRASCDPNGKPFNPNRKLISWNGTAWGGADIPDFKADEDPTHGMGPFIMNAEGVARFFARTLMNEGPFPEHYEPMDTPLANNPLSPSQPLSLRNPAARVFEDDRKAFGTPDKFPHAGTTYRLTEHFHFWTKHARMNAIIQPEQFVEIGDALAQGAGYRLRRHGEGRVEPRLHQGQGGRDQTLAQAADRREAVPPRRHPDSLGLQRPRQAGFHRQHADQLRR